MTAGDRSRSPSPARAVAAALAALAAGCAPPAAVPAVRFANAPPTAAVDDRRDVPARPAAGAFWRLLYHFDGSFYRLVTRGLELPRARRALGVNALDEVPDSTWFTNRIGARELSPEEVGRGPAVIGSPEPHRPWTIHSTKVGGASIGFIITDARGVRFLLKFDRAGFPEVETAAEVIAGKLLWAAGYNVPEDHVVYLGPADLIIAPDAVVKDRVGVRGKLTRAQLDAALALVVREPDGQIRGMASRMIEGKPLGGHAAEGVRRDDPNDRIPHELRRDLRGAYVFYAWLDLTDVKEDNTLDVYAADPADPSRHYVKHYLLDFGSAFGAAALFEANLREGYEYKVDFPGMFASLATLGLRERSWERRRPVGLRGVGVLDRGAFSPGAWKAETPAYLPFRVADDRDKLWATKILMRFTRAQIRAAVEAGRLSDGRATEYITEALVARQRAIGRRWLARASPLDRFAPAASGRALCFDDLLLAYRLAPASLVTRYRVAAYDRAGRPLGATTGLRPDASGHACAPVALAPGGDGYTIVRIDTARRGARAMTVYVHLARSTAGTPRVIGVWRP